MIRLLRFFIGLALILLLLAFGAYTIFVYAPLPERATLLPKDYFEGRKNFLTRATAKKAEVESYKIAATGPEGEPLFIDIAWLGSKTPQRVLLHISGTHGVEGFAGSAIQSAILDQEISLPNNSALILVHALNPWGMAHLRRFNESNVDLNRNFLLDSDKYQGAPDSYRLVDSFLNPKEMPAKLDMFLPQAIYLTLRHGFDPLKQAIAGGQYEYATGIYFGGKKQEESTKFFLSWVKQNLSGVQGVFVIEIHTGLGTSGVDTIFWPLPLSDIRTRTVGKFLGEQFSSDAPDEGVGFKTPGDLQNEVPKVLPGVKVAWTLQEFGAYGPVTTLRALRNENAYHHYGQRKVDHWTKRELLEAFAPGSEDWQKKIISRGVVLANKSLKLLDTNLKVESLVDQPS